MGRRRLKKLQLGRNRLAALDMLSHVTNLTQLSVEDNELSSLAGLEPLVCLMELYAGEPPARGTHAAPQPAAATHMRAAAAPLAPLRPGTRVLARTSSGSALSVEAHGESWTWHFCGWPPAAGNNRIHELREVQRLRELPKIIILDLSGNPCTASAADDYRLYVIFNVRKLKVSSRLSLRQPNSCVADLDTQEWLRYAWPVHGVTPIRGDGLA